MAAPVISGISPDTGRSSNDEITSAGLITISGTSNNNASVTVMDGTTTLGSVQASQGAWSIVASLSGGTHSLTATSAQGISAAVPVTIDNSAPAAPSFTAITPDNG